MSRKALHMESSRLRSEITLLQEQLDQRASDINTTTGTSYAHESRPPSSNSRLNSAQKFRQMVTSSRNSDHDL